MSASKKEAYKVENERFLLDMKKKGVKELPGNILYEIVRHSDNLQHPNLNSIVTVNYVGTLINGYEFDNSYKRGFPEAFRLRDVIEGWQIALQRMCHGERWIVYIPYSLGYGKKANGDIPAFSTLVFDIELLGIM
jgi:FKBP-type peptidyl-prolyl cis-trans isomerases 1